MLTLQSNNSISIYSLVKWMSCQKPLLLSTKIMLNSWDEHIIYLWRWVWHSYMIKT